MPQVQTMTDENEVQVPSTTYENIRKVTFIPSKNVVAVRTSNTFEKVKNANENLIPEEVNTDSVSTGYIGGIDRLKVSAFSENIQEVLVAIEEIECSDDILSVKMKSNHNLPVTLQFREKHGECQAVITNRERL